MYNSGPNTEPWGVSVCRRSVLGHGNNSHTVDHHCTQLSSCSPDHQPSSYDLRPRTHDKLLLNKTSSHINEWSWICHSHALLYRDYCICPRNVHELCLKFSFLSSVIYTSFFVRSCVCQLFQRIKWMNEWIFTAVVWWTPENFDLVCVELQPIWSWPSRDVAYWDANTRDDERYTPLHSIADRRQISTGPKG